MFAVWRLIREQVDLHGARSVNAACTRFALLKVTQQDGFIADAVTEPGTLRQRFYEAERARKEPEHYPILAARCDAYLESMKRLKAAQQQLSQSYADMARDGYARDGSTLPETEKLTLALKNKYTKK
tara:strand:- start:44572 stop:44952 length:381 start_codon:yes stop_codon:yes gene_type:complete